MRYRVREPALRKILCGQYVLGTLVGQARRRLEHLLPGDGALRAELRWWEQRLGLLALRLAPVRPREVVWIQLQRRVQALAEAGNTQTRRLQRQTWQRWAWLATAASVILGIALVWNIQQPFPPLPI